MGFQRALREHVPDPHVFKGNLRTIPDAVQDTPPGQRRAVSRACVYTLNMHARRLRLRRQDTDGLASAHAGSQAHLSFTRSDSNQPRVCVSAGAVGELWFRAVPGGPDSRLGRHIKHTSTHSRRTCPSSFTQDKHRCMLSLQSGKYQTKELINSCCLQVTRVETISHAQAGKMLLKIPKCAFYCVFFFLGAQRLKPSLISGEHKPLLSVFNQEYYLHFME